MRWVALAIAAAALPGCAENAFLEVALSLPAPGACASRTAALEGRFLEPDETACPADVAWTTDRQLFALGAAPATHLVDVEAVGEDVELDLCLRVRFCASDDCVGHDVVVEPSTTVVVERPFARGRRTAVDLRVDDPCAVGRVLDPIAR